MNSIIAIIQARVNSTRLPGKVLLDLSGKKVLEHVMERVKRARLIKEAVVATTLVEDDLRVVEVCVKNNMRVYCGSVDDVLDRYFQCSRLLGAEHIVRITSDCPLIDPGIIDRAVSLHLSGRADYTSNSIRPTFPDGEDVEVIAFSALEKAWSSARLRSDREHVTPYIKNRPKQFRLAGFECDKDYSSKRWTLDEDRDYEFIKIVYGNLYKKGRIFGMNEVLRFLRKYPEYEKINSCIARNEGYAKSLNEDSIMRANYRMR